MKKIIKTLLVVMVLAVVLTAFTACDVKGALNGIIPPELTCAVLGHKGGEATCLQGAECERCGVEYGELGEHEKAYKSPVSPTCTKDGITVGMYCPTCGETLVEQTVVPALGHVSKEFGKTEPTCQTPGEEAGTYCDRCKAVLTGGAEIPVIDCIYGEDHYCTMCEQLDPSVCLHENMTETVVAPTCGDDGYTRHDCDDCEYYYDTDPTTATGNHTWDEGVVTTAPGCETTGVRTHTCTVCDATKTEDEPAAGHNFLYSGGTCSVCLLNGVQTVDPDFKLNYVVAGQENTVIVDNHHLVDIKDGIGNDHGFPYQFTLLTVLQEGTYTFTSGNNRFIAFTIFTTQYSDLSGNVNPDADFTPNVGASWATYLPGLNDDFSLNEIHLEPGVYYIGMIYMGGADYNEAVGEYKVIINSVCEHNAEGTVAHKDPTCTEAGVVGGTYCTRCDNGKAAAEATIDALGHKDANAEGKCDVCEAYFLPAVGTAFKLRMDQASLGKVLYFNGKMSGYYYATGDYSEAVDLYLEEAEGGYYIYFLNGETRNYLYVVASGTHNNVKIGSEKSVWTFNVELGTFETVLNDTPLYLGTYSTNSTIGVSKTSYIDANNVNISQFAARAVIVPEHECAYSEETCACEICGHIEHIDTDADHDCDRAACEVTVGVCADGDDEDILCDYGCGKEFKEGAALSNAVLDLSNSSNRISFSTTEQVWSANGITVTNKKGNGSDIADYTPPRFYKNSTVIIEGSGMTKIVLVCNSSSYATALKDSIGTQNGVTVSVSGSTVTVTFAEAVDSFTINLTAGQVRMGNSITVNP